MSYYKPLADESSGSHGAATEEKHGNLRDKDEGKHRDKTDRTSSELAHGEFKEKVVDLLKDEGYTNTK